MHPFKTKILDALINDLKENPQALAVWEAGSKANGSSDEFSDIDLNVVGGTSIDGLFDSMESTLNRVSTITHREIEPKCFWPGCYQRVYFLKEAPKHFYVDIAVLLQESKDTLHEFLDVDRHGVPFVHFDRPGLLKPRNSDLEILRTKQLKRLKEIQGAYPVYKTEVLKELDRGLPIDAFAFYQNGMVRPLAELMGILHRPFRFDFGLRYLHKTFPKEDQRIIERLLYVKSVEEIRENILEVDRLFQDTVLRVQERLGINPD